MKQMKMKDRIGMVIVALLLAAAVASVCSAMADRGLTDAWVMCQPDSYINIRARASSQSRAEGYLISGDRIRIDGQTKGAFAHAVVSTESGEGWIHAGYIVFEEPVEIGRKCRIRADGRVACRRTIDGERRCWVIDGSEVYVYMAGGGWAVTDKGFIQSQYIDMGERK